MRALRLRAVKSVTQVRDGVGILPQACPLQTWSCFHLSRKVRELKLQRRVKRKVRHTQQGRGHPLILRSDSSSRYQGLMSQSTPSVLMITTEWGKAPSNLNRKETDCLGIEA